MGRAVLPLLLLVAGAAGGCATAGIREEATRAEGLLPPEAGGRLLATAWERLEAGKRIFDIRYGDRARVLNGTGAIVYEKDPLRLRLDVFGPHSTEVLAVAQIGDSLAVVLPQERRYVAGPVGDPAFGQFAEGRTFTGPELLGALVGAYDVAALIGSVADTLAYGSGDGWVVALIEPDRAHRFAFASDSTLREYRQERNGRPTYRVRFDDYREVAGAPRPFRIELDDLAERRAVRARVRRENLGDTLPDDAYWIDPL